MAFRGTLYPYQVPAVDLMVSRKKVLVAYDLGLGKTCLTIAAIETMMDSYEIKEPGIVVCLSSLKYQWAGQIEKFTEGTSKSIVIDGTKAQREAQYQAARDWRETKVDYIIMNYEQVVNDWDFVKNLPRGFLILDEATAIKSFRSKRSKQVKKMADTPIKFALTGTPIENGKPEELFSICQLVDSSLLGRFDIFDATFIVRNNWGGVARYRNLPVLHERLKEACVRKSQKDPDVAPYLPEAIHKDPIKIVFNRKSAQLYERIRKDLLLDLDEAQDMFGSNFNLLSHYGLESKGGGPEDEWRGRIMSKVGALKMLCSHPDLIRTSATKFHQLNGEGSKYASELVSEGLLEGVNTSNKLDFLIQYVKDFLEQDEANKVVIFATYVDMLGRISSALGEGRCRLYSGKLDAKTKEANKIAFNTDPAIKVLISSDAGGYGVDLPAANLLVNYDLPWSSGAATQRNGRIVRASSGFKSVVIQDVIMDGSIEQRQWEALQQKNAVANAIVDGVGINAEGGVPLNVGSLRQFLTLATV